jgi:hypothetical protein
MLGDDPELRPGSICNTAVIDHVFVGHHSALLTTGSGCVENY